MRSELQFLRIFPFVSLSYLNFFIGNSSPYYLHPAVRSNVSYPNFITGNLNLSILTFYVCVCKSYKQPVISCINYATILTISSKYALSFNRACTDGRVVEGVATDC